MELKKRGEIPASECWNLTDLYATEEEYQEDLASLRRDLSGLEEISFPALSPEEIHEKIKLYESLLIRLSRASHYANLNLAVAMGEAEHQMRASAFDLFQQETMNRLAPFEEALRSLPIEVLEQQIALAPAYRSFLHDLIDFKPHKLQDETEKALVALHSLQELPYQLYSQSKLADLSFPPFALSGEEYPLSFVLFENHYQYHPETALRREAFRSFSEQLKKYQHTFSTAYIGQVQKEKALATLRGFPSLFDYLLFSQKISRKVYDNHLDVLMESLSPVMQRYARHLQKIHALEELHYSDLKLPLETLSSSLSIEEAKNYARKALSQMGEDYAEIIDQALDKRWIDWAQNLGKTTGGFCAAPYNVHPYILLSWTGQWGDLFTLVHELGHVGHFELAGRAQSYLNIEPSLYFIEAPSTMNELLLSQHLMKESEDPALRRRVISSLLSNTYYHNCVTHFLEAWFQREVYLLVDQGEALTTERLHQLMEETLRRFWGTAVALDAGAELTWMRQPHYYMGLYPYTYSAGLSLATSMVQRMEADPTLISQWKAILSKGGSCTPQELASMAGVDLEDSLFLKETVHYIHSLLEEHKGCSAF